MASSFFSDFFPRRAPAARVQSVAFRLRNIYIVPTLAGLGLLGVVLLTLIAAINFQNSLIYITCFWLAALLLINILHTFRNLAGLRVELLGVEPCFAGQSCLVRLRLHSAQPRDSVFIGWKGIDLVQPELQQAQMVDVSLSCPAERRGWLQPPRLQVFTRYPTGLSYAWGYANLDINALVYPEPIMMDTDTLTGEGGELEDGDQAIAGGVNDFTGMRAYVPGDNPRRIHWAKYAQTGKLHSKVFVDYPHHDRWLDWYVLPGGSDEQRLSHLCARVIEFDQKHQRYGLRIPGTTIEPGSGESHRHACLTALALYGLEGASA